MPDHLKINVQEERLLWEERGKQGKPEEEHKQGQEWKSDQQVDSFLFFDCLLVYLFVGEQEMET